MTRQGVLAIIISVLLSLAAAYTATRVQVQDIDTREKLNSTAAERAIERVSGDAEKRVDRVEQKIDDRMNKLENKIDGIIQTQTETSLIIRRLDRREQ